MTDSALVDVEAGIGCITLNRPAALNALDEDMAFSLAAASRALAQDATVRCIVLRGAGGHFMAGGDLLAFHQWLALDAPAREARVRALIAPVHETIRTLHAAPKPVIAVVRGACAGFGLSLMSACDLAVAASDSTFSMAYCRIGTSPDGGATASLPRIVGLRASLELALLGDRFDASRALELGLVNEVVPSGELDCASRALAARLAAGPASALARTRALIRATASGALEAQLAAEEESFVRCVTEADFEEGVRAFVEKRPPRFQGAPAIDPASRA